MSHSVESDKTDQYKVKRGASLSKSGGAQAQKLLYSIVSLEIPKHILQDRKKNGGIKVMKSVSPWTKASRLPKSVDNFRISKCPNPTATLRRRCFSVFIP